MERSESPTPRREKSSSEDQDQDTQGGGTGCGGCLKMKVPIKNLWKRSRNYIRQQSSRSSCKSSVATAVLQPKKPKFHGGFRYDPLSYAQNFDEGVVEFDNQDDYPHLFSSRFAALPATKSTGQYKFLNQ